MTRPGGRPVPRPGGRPVPRLLFAPVLLIAIALIAVAPPPAHAGTPQPPDWVLAAAHAATPDYPKTTMAVALDDEETLTVQPDGKATLLKRRVIKILRPQGRNFATVVVPIDRDRKLRSLHIWGIASDGHPNTLRDNEIAEIGDNEYGMLYVDLHAKVARAPAADPGAVVAYEYERTMRPYVQEYSWDFQDSIPTLHSVFELVLPPDWHYSVAARNAVADRKDDTGVVTSQPAPGHYRWRFDRVPGVDIEDVPMTPEFEAMAGRLVVRYSRDPQPTGDDRWTAIGNWYTTLASPSAQATPDLSARAKELVAGQSDFTARLQNIASYMQRNIRYVGIEIGIGGLQPHSADDVFRNRYGDCKDKATLLRAMLESVGIHSTWVLVDTRRGFVDPQIPSIDGNHAIAAIEIPAGYSNPVLQSIVTAKSGKRYLIFDPTNQWIPIGQIPPYLQGGYGVLSEGGQSQLIALPVMAQPPTAPNTLSTRSSMPTVRLRPRSSSNASATPLKDRASPSPKAAGSSSATTSNSASAAISTASRSRKLPLSTPPISAALSSSTTASTLQATRAPPAIYCSSVRASSAPTPGLCRAKPAHGPSISMPSKPAAITSSSPCRPVMSSTSSPSPSRSTPTSPPTTAPSPPMARHCTTPANTP